MAANKTVKIALSDMVIIEVGTVLDGRYLGLYGGICLAKGNWFAQSLHLTSR
jgi:hypothetical protein